PRLELTRQQIHQQTVVPGAVGPALVLAPHADPPEADPLIRPDRSLVGENWIDRQAVMTALAEEMAREHANRLAAVALILVRLGEEDVDARVAVVGIELLGAHDDTGEAAVDVDRERRRPRGLEQLLADPAGVERAPPARHRGLLPC